MACSQHEHGTIAHPQFPVGPAPPARPKLTCSSEGRNRSRMHCSITDSVMAKWHQNISKCNVLAMGLMHFAYTTQSLFLSFKALGAIRIAIYFEATDIDQVSFVKVTIQWSMALMAISLLAGDCILRGVSQDLPKKQVFERQSVRLAVLE